MLAPEPLAQLRKLEDSTDPNLVADIIRDFLRDAPLAIASMASAAEQGRPAGAWSSWPTP